MRVSIVVAVGAMGEQEDLEKFMELCRADFEYRAHKIAAHIMRGRVTILPMSESIEAPDAETNEARDQGLAE